MLDALDNADLVTKLHLSFAKKVKDEHQLAGGDLLDVIIGLSETVSEDLFTLRRRRRQRKRR